jgi:hypothetical protein
MKRNSDNSHTIFLQKVTRDNPVDVPGEDRLEEDMKEVDRVDIPKAAELLDEGYKQN